MKESKYSLGIELGSTRIKAVVVDYSGLIISSSDLEWCSKFENGFWTYDLAEVDKGVLEVINKLDCNLADIETVGISAMMHGYLAFDKDDNILTPFRTWQNTNTSEAAQKLSESFGFNIPERWSVSHIYQAVLNQEDHITKISYITTLAGYVHYKLTGKKCLGIGDASGMFPIETSTKQYSIQMVEEFDKLIPAEVLKSWGGSILNILPEIKLAGEDAGKGEGVFCLKQPALSGAKFCPPEGDAGTGMIATNAIKPKTGNVSAGTSVFAMVVLNKPLKSYYQAVDVVTTPLGDEVAMIHANNCTLDINAWVKLFGEVISAYGCELDMNKLYTTLFNLALKGDKDGGGLINFPYVTGEQIVDFKDGKPAFIRQTENSFSLANFMRVQLMSSLCALKIGFDILKNNENVEVNQLLGHGGYFKTEKVGQEIMSSALNCEIGVMETANEGGAWGMAILANYRAQKQINPELKLTDFLDFTVFKNTSVNSFKASTADVDGFNNYMKNFNKELDNIK